MDRATICIPAYNAEHTIRETLDSILNQNYTNLEIIVSDNHSTDRTVEVVGEYAERGVSIVTCPLLPVHSGSLLDNCYSSIQNWNSLQSQGEGKYIGIFHADDCYASNLVAEQVKIFEKHADCSAVFSMLRYIDINSNFLDKDWVTFSQEEVFYLDQQEFINMVAERRHFFSSSGVMLRRDKWIEAGAFDALRWGQQVDTEFWIRIAGYGPIAIINQPLVFHRIHPMQDTSRWKQIYRHQQVPFLDIMDHYLIDKGFNNGLPRESSEKLECFRMKEKMRVARNWVHDGNNKFALNSLKDFDNFSLKDFLKYVKLNEKRYAVKAAISRMIYHSIVLKSSFITRFFVKVYDNFD